ncbi:EKC/KEOPS complex subunit Tprkb-like [Penaeus japonicus]|uniref:EKC/KEOPS complex subunit Tprkb-like n=1 Tax=Penaeus japonicus TaxID=27405 RepID=UPI001C70D204|nr:EKC/KEOPS complex subunit Tprkb-like [Penaeus japonicus]XP_042871657.1 EKC/KEOPS complex subunit Tprkb-like [Penaeus japonicus]XP_042871659.1 EKC/KEOPS complex subunit Tprkb-like [Penaeus japonicus]XP_042871660.1 EKC/KEOPS complex subunit Tprkb-like [Penaeus japonicus]
MSVTVTLEDEAQTKCHVLLYNIENAAEVRQLIMKGQVEASLIKPEMIVDPFQVIVAANKAQRSSALKKMTTRSVYAEIIYNLSPTRTITESLKTFGLGDDDTHILAVVLDNGSGEKLRQINGQIKGKEMPVAELSSLTNISKVTELYKVTDLELTVTSLVDSVVSRMACKEFLLL